MPAPQTFVLTRDNQQATVASHGGRVVDYEVNGCEVLAGTESSALFAFRGSLLAPWPNRTVGGRWTWQGRHLELPVNDPGSGAALHGLVYDVAWNLDRVDAESIWLHYDLPATPGYPFPLQLVIHYELGADGLACALSATNVGTEAAPVGLGVHPYLATPGLVDELQVTIPADTVLEADDRWRETGRRPVEDVGLDFRSPRPIGELVLDTAFTDVMQGADGRSEAVVLRPDGATVVLWAGSTCRWWLVYTGHTLAPDERRRSLAVEPMTCPANALNTGEIDVLAPGDSLSLHWGFRLR